MFNVRSYGVVVQDNKVLLSRECIRGKEIVKFPGGGLLFGEGLADCIKREFMEEYGVRVEVGNSFYVTDFFVPSAFDKTQQVISVYFETRITDPKPIPLNRIDNPGDGAAQWHQLTWFEIQDLHEEIFYFPIDKKVAALLRQKANQ